MARKKKLKLKKTNMPKTLQDIANDLTAAVTALTQTVADLQAVMSQPVTAVTPTEVDVKNSDGTETVFVPKV